MLSRVVFDPASSVGRAALGLLPCSEASDLFRMLLRDKGSPPSIRGSVIG